ncbi:MAG TPA: hypothetical protein VFC78_05110 [Tepidisphaeraceae bacterium]|nr:hypothetical protein [Tepidisphaeraceae bacterium]
MSAPSVIEIEALIERLDLKDQVLLLQFLTPKIAAGVLADGRRDASVTENAEADADALWQEYRKVGERLAATSVPGAASLTDAVSEMRR